MDTRSSKGWPRGSHQGMSALLSASEQAVPLWDVGHGSSVCVWTALSSGTAMGGWFGLCQCFSKQTGWPFPQLLPLPETLLRSDLEKTILFPPTHPSPIHFLSPAVAFESCHPPASLLAMGTVSPRDEKPCSRASYSRAKTELQARPRICPTFPSWPSCT